MDTINKITKSGEQIEPAYIKKRGIILLRRVDNMIYLSGHGPEDDATGEPIFKGRIGSDLSPEEGYAAARECAIIILGALKDTLGDLDRVEQIVKVFAFVNCAEGFNEIDEVMDGFSDTIVDTLEERGYHTRTVMGTHNLPNNNIPVEVEVIVSVRE